MKTHKIISGGDKVILNVLFAILLFWGSFLFVNNGGGDPGFAIRHLGISLFCLCYVAYFILYRRAIFPALGVWPKISLLGYLLFTVTGFMAAFLGVNFREGILPTLININFLVLILITIHALYNGLRVTGITFILVLIGGFAGLFGVFQYYGMLPDILIVGSPPTGLQFNRNFFGSSQVLLLPFVVLSLQKATGVKKYISAGSLVIVLWSISISQTRSAVLSLIVYGIVVLAVVILRQQKGNPVNLNKKALFAGIVIFFLGAGVLSTNYFRGILNSVNRHLRTEAESNKRQNSIQERLDIWRGSIGIIEDHPLVGVGFGNWKIHYAGVTNQPYRAQTGRIVTAKAHNVYLEILSETGIVGFGFYAIFIIGLLLIIYKYVIVDSAAMILGAGLFAFLTDYLFSFGNYQPSHMIYAGLMIGYLLYLPNHDRSTDKHSNAVRAIALSAFILVLLAAYWSLSLILFELSIKKGQLSSAQGDHRTALYHFDNAIDNVHALNRQGDSPHLQKAFVYNKMRNYEAAIVELRLAWKDNPHSSRLNATFGDVYFAKQDLNKASVYYQKAFDVQSKNLAIGEKLAITYFELKHYDKCVEVLGPLEKMLNPNLKMMLQISKMNTRNK